MTEAITIEILDEPITIVVDDGAISLEVQDETVILITDQGERGSSGCGEYMELTTDTTFTDALDHRKFMNTMAVAMVPITVDSSDLTSFEAIVTNAVGFKIINPGTIYIAGRAVMTDIFSITPMAVAKVLVINQTTLMVQTFGPWEE